MFISSDNNTINIEALRGLDMQKSVKIFDSMGKVVLNTVTSSNTININHFSRGIYFIQIGTKTETYNTMVFKD